MAERLAGTLVGHGEHEQARGSVVSDDDLRLVRVVVPFEQDRVTSIVAGGEVYEHASIVRLLPTTSHPYQTLGCPRDRPVVNPGRRVRDGRHRPARAARGDGPWEQPGSRPREPPSGVARRSSWLRRSAPSVTGRRST